MKDNNTYTDGGGNKGVHSPATTTVRVMPSSQQGAHPSRSEDDTVRPTWARGGPAGDMAVPPNKRVMSTLVLPKATRSNPID